MCGLPSNPDNQMGYLMNEWLLLIPIEVLVLVTAPAFAWLHHVNQRDRREGVNRAPRNRWSRIRLVVPSPQDRQP